MKQPKYSTGIDIASLDFVVSIAAKPGIALHGPKKFDNNPEGFKKLDVWFKQNKLTQKNMLICMEATGVYGEDLCYFLHGKKYSLVVEQALKVKRAFKLNNHKTDAVDSLQIAKYGIRFYDELILWEPREEIVEKMNALITTRELLVGHKAAAMKSLTALRRKTVGSAAAIRILKSYIDTTATKIANLGKEMDKLILNQPKMRQTVDNLKTMPGVNNLLAYNMLVVTNGFKSQKHHKQLCSYLKIVPLMHESGSSIYKRPSVPKFGPPIMRKLLYLASLSAVTHKPVFRKYYLRKQAEGKVKRLIINNVENKLVKIMCALIRDQKPYIENYQSVHPNLLKMA